MSERSSSRAKTYFVHEIRGRWLLLLLSPTLLIPLLSFPDIVPKEWVLPLIFAAYGFVCAVSAVQPWIRHKRSFWLSLPVGCIVPLVVGHVINVRIGTQSRSELRGAAFLTILAGYAVVIPLFWLLQKGEQKNPLK